MILILHVLLYIVSDLAVIEKKDDTPRV